MNRTEHLLSCLAEECCEVGQRVSKSLRFGLEEIQPGQPLTNAQRISAELKDLIAVARILQSIESAIPACVPTAAEITAKWDKIEKFMAISREQGVLS